MPAVATSNHAADCGVAGIGQDKAVVRGRAGLLVQNKHVSIGQAVGPERAQRGVDEAQGVRDG